MRASWAPLMLTGDIDGRSSAGICSAGRQVRAQRVNGGFDDLTFAPHPDADSIAGAALDQALEATDARMGNVQLVQWGKRPALEIVHHQGFKDEFLDVFRSVSMTDPSACGRALVLRRTIVIDDVLTDEEFLPFRAVARRAGFRSVQSTPLISSNGALYGVLSTHAPEPRRPSGQQLAALQAIAQAAADAIVKRRIAR